MIVTVITPSNVAIFPEYIIPNIKHLVQDPEVSVRCTYAQCIVQLADTALRYLEMGQALRAHGAFNLSAEAQEYDNAHFEVCCELRWFCCHLVLPVVDFLRCKYARATKSSSGSSLRPAHGPIEYCEACCLT